MCLMCQLMQVFTFLQLKKHNVVFVPYLVQSCLPETPFHPGLQADVWTKLQGKACMDKHFDMIHEPYISTEDEAEMFCL